MYIRTNSNCQVLDKQPAHVNVQDAFGNTFENWCADYVRTDSDNFPIGVVPNPSAVAAPTDLDPVYFADPIYAWVETSDGTKYYYELIAYNGLPASQKSWAQAEEARGYVNMPWVADGTSALMAEKYDDFAFLHNPTYFNNAGDLPPEATFVKPGDPVPIGPNGGLLYYQGDDQLHYVVAGTQDKAQKLQMYIGVAASAPPASATGCLAQDPDDLLDKWIPHDKDNNPTNVFAFIDSPLIPGTSLEEAVTLDGVAILGLEEDRDLVLYNANNTQALQLEDSTQVLSSATF